ncbi:MAG: hypothetical protein PHI34_03755 [Acidobacteriota bacterium]|nr:hypothetical protein [Acidobacteriota bacterium]
MKKNLDLNSKLSVRRCRRRASGLLLILLAAGLVFVPVRNDEIIYQRDPQTNHVWKTTSRRNAYMNLPAFLKRDRTPFPTESSYQVRYSLWRMQAANETRARINFPLALGELGLLIGLAVYDWFFFCRRRRKRPFASLSSPR